MSNETPAPAHPDVTDHPDVTEMTAVHRVFRNALAMAPNLIGGVTDGDTERAAVVGGFFRNILEFLHLHHEGEDELLFPKLVERAPDPEFVKGIQSQHELVHGALDRSNAAVERFVASGSTADGRELLDALAELDAAATPHLDEEEEKILPLVSEYITLPEWEELPGHALKAYTGDLWLILGLVREQFTDEQKARMEAGMPPPLVEAWKGPGLASYKASVAALVGTPG